MKLKNRSKNLQISENSNFQSDLSPILIGYIAVSPSTRYFLFINYNNNKKN